MNTWWTWPALLWGAGVGVKQSTDNLVSKWVLPRSADLHTWFSSKRPLADMLRPQLPPDLLRQASWPFTVSANYLRPLISTLRCLDSLSSSPSKANISRSTPNSIYQPSGDKAVHRDTKGRSWGAWWVEAPPPLLSRTEPWCWFCSRLV